MVSKEPPDRPPARWSDDVIDTRPEIKPKETCQQVIWSSSNKGLDTTNFTNEDIHTLIALLSKDIVDDLGTPITYNTMLFRLIDNANL